MNDRFFIALLFSTCLLTSRAAPLVSTLNTSEQRIANTKAHIIFDSCFALASFNLQNQLLQNPLVDGALQHIEALGKCCVGEFGAARKQRSAGSRLIQDGLSNHKKTVLIKSSQLAFAYAFKNICDLHIDKTIAPINLHPPPSLHHQTAHTAASFISTYFVMDAWRNFMANGPTSKALMSTGYLAATLALNYHQGELLDKYLLKSKRKWSILDKQLAMAKNIIPSLVAYSFCG